MNEALATVKQPSPQSTSLGLAPNGHQSIAPSVVPLDRENLTFFANMIKAAGLIPEVNGVSREMSFNRVMAKIVAGTAYGFDPMLAQTCFDVAFNVVSPNAKGQGVLFRQSGEFDLRIVRHDDKGCKVIVLRLIDEKWKEIGVVEFNEAMAKSAGLLNKDIWKKYPMDMYYARVITRVVKRFNPSCLIPRLVLGNHFAKESQPTYVPPAQAEAAQLAPAIEEAAETHEVEGDDHEDPEYAGPPPGGYEGEESDAEVDGEVVIISEPESEEVTAESVETLLGMKFEGDEGLIKKFLNGRTLNSMDLKQLTLLRDEIAKA